MNAGLTYIAFTVLFFFYCCIVLTVDVNVRFPQTNLTKQLFFLDLKNKIQIILKYLKLNLLLSYIIILKQFIFC